MMPHLRTVMGYTIRTAEWRYTEWVGVTRLQGDDYQPNWNQQKVTIIHLFSFGEFSEQFHNFILRTVLSCTVWWATPRRIPMWPGGPTWRR